LLWQLGSGHNPIQPFVSRAALEPFWSSVIAVVTCRQYVQAFQWASER
jgi:hypothetical protein